MVDPEGGYQVRYPAMDRDAQYLALGPQGHVTPAVVTTDRSSNLLSPFQAATYVVITTRALAEVAEGLAELRRARGLSAMVVDIEDIYDELNHGIADPHAIRDFIAWAREHWLDPPVFVSLAGAGTYDFRDLLAAGGNLIPPLLARSSSSIFATDTPLADIDSDGVAEVAVGRIPVTSASELADYIAKVAAYEGSTGEAIDREVVFLADDPDGGGRFPEDTDVLASQLDPSTPRQKIYLSVDRLPEARQRLADAFADDPFLIHYYGHGGVDRLASEGLLTSADVGSLGGSGRALVAAVSCHIGLFALPGFDALAEHLVRAPKGGAIAVIAPVWLSHHGQARALGSELLERLVTEEGAGSTVGQAFLGAIEGLAGTGAALPLLQTYNLLGDPALQLPP